MDTALLLVGLAALYAYATWDLGRDWRPPTPSDRAPQEPSPHRLASKLPSWRRWDAGTTLDPPPPRKASTGGSRWTHSTSR